MTNMNIEVLVDADAVACQAAAVIAAAARDAVGRIAASYRQWVDLFEQAK